jgi:uncharacterized damage-inducible protein DinB
LILLEEAHMEAKELVRMYERSYIGIKLNLRDITEEDARRQPPGGANCIGWVLGHLVMTRRLVLRSAGAEPAGDPALVEIYSGEEGVSFDPSRAFPLERLLADLDESQRRLLPALAQLTPEALSGPVRTTVLGDFLAFLAFHEGYHNGQLGVLRRLAGKPGVIKQPQGLVTPQTA